MDELEKRRASAHHKQKCRASQRPKQSTCHTGHYCQRVDRKFIEKREIIEKIYRKNGKLSKKFVEKNLDNHVNHI